MYMYKYLKGDKNFILDLYEIEIFKWKEDESVFLEIYNFLVMLE